MAPHAACGATDWQGMDVMRLKLAIIALGALAALSGPARADGFAWSAGINDLSTPPSEAVRWGSGMKDMAVPAPIPVQEGFTYYFRGDLGYGWADARSLSETGLIYGEDIAAPGVPFTSSSP